MLWLSAIKAVLLQLQNIVNGDEASIPDGYVALVIIGGYLPHGWQVRDSSTM